MLRELVTEAGNGDLRISIVPQSASPKIYLCSPRGELGHAPSWLSARILYLGNDKMAAVELELRPAGRIVITNKISHHH